MDKRSQRQHARASVGAMSEQQRAQAGGRVCAQIAALDEFVRASTLLVFAPMLDEPDIGDVAQLALAAGKVVCAPRVDWTRWMMEAWPIGRWPQDLEPDPQARRPDQRRPVARAGARALAPDELDLVLVPGLAFTLRGERLGRGGGFYDRLLASLPARTRTVGVCFACQVVSQLATESHDARVGRVVAG
jgi:5-formyltetrahydrofolate cyclo-ligase